MDRREIYSLTGSIVRITAPDDGVVWLFSVESAAGTMAVLRPCNTGSKEFAKAVEPGTELALTAGTSDGVLHGLLTVQRWSPGQRMLVVDNPPLEFSQRRESFRVRAAVPVEVLVGARLVRGTTHDLSQGGGAIALPADVDVAVGDELLVVVRTERRPILVAAAVLGRHPDVRNAVRTRFVQITPFDQSVLAAEIRRLEVAKVSTARQMLSSR
ncbi:MAG: PilZ domain-containing protein [Acidimicrobiales bacterium]|nr:PilZ domain-containing protein [Acidimicrobiales bacterium]MCB9392426.1 PilZ domain-containing protein [Acidimicrobiaceae bacterium]